MPPKKKDEKKEVDDAGKEDVGVFYFADGSKYDGQVTRKGEPPVLKRHGYGVYYDGGTSFDGQWVDDAMTGEGTLQLDTGASFVGTFYNNCFNGRGKYTWADGSYYEGQWRNNAMHGEGVYVDSRGRRWAGKFYDGSGPKLIQEVA